MQRRTLIDFAKGCELVLEEMPADDKRAVLTRELSRYLSALAFSDLISAAVEMLGLEPSPHASVEQQAVQCVQVLAGADEMDAVVRAAKHMREARQAFDPGVFRWPEGKVYDSVLAAGETAAQDALTARSAFALHITSERSTLDEVRGAKERLWVLAQTIERKARRDENAAQWLGKVLHRLHTRASELAMFLIAKENEALKAEIDAAVAVCFDGRTALASLVEIRDRQMKPLLEKKEAADKAAEAAKAKGEHALNGFEYKLDNQETNFEAHEQKAVAWGGHVTSIVNQEERDHVRRIAGNQTVWIGARRHGGGNGPGPNHWLWVDGTRWEYTAWERGEPNNAGGREDRVQMYGHNGHWNDVHSGWGGRAVYKKRAAPVMTEEERRRHAWMQGAFEPLLKRKQQLDEQIVLKENEALKAEIDAAVAVCFDGRTALASLRGDTRSSDEATAREEGSSGQGRGSGKGEGRARTERLRVQARQSGDELRGSRAKGGGMGRARDVHREPRGARSCASYCRQPDSVDRRAPSRRRQRARAKPLAVGRWHAMGVHSMGAWRAEQCWWS